MAVDFDGRQAWHKSIGALNAPHGSAGSPLPYKDRVIVYQDHRGGGFIAAYDAKTGAERWKTPRAEQVGWGTRRHRHACRVEGSEGVSLRAVTAAL